ncbi:LysR family transcriptional regulator [Agrobacterium sp. Ap1]|uniref:LysR family transcriptional regulator n=1 Tax=Agrobacterium sp. Ap1 TaxID=2815337 RepID=UPI001A8EB5D4|nr:LysR family transcriptional regulator [Agrobacterium sp. Ap1]MBO0143407.1 LysR family transcriptional regulator [Agrobacterium sp. Ap1]
MDRTVLRDLAVFEVVARRQSFTKAAADLGISQAALSYAITQLEQRLGVALLARTTRNVSPTEAGTRLLATLQPALRGIEAELQGLQDMRSHVAGTIRLTTVQVAYDMLIRPKLSGFFARYPHVSMEVSVNDGLTDVISASFDGGIRFGSLVEKDMVAVGLSSTSPAAIVGSPGYLASFKSLPSTPADLQSHRCVNYRFATSGRIFRWPLEKNDTRFEFRGDGPLVLDSGEAIRAAALDGLGLAFLFESQVAGDLAAGTLVKVLPDWVRPLPGFSLFYPSRQQVSPAFRAWIDYMKDSKSDHSSPAGLEV